MNDQQIPFFYGSIKAGKHHHRAVVMHFTRFGAMFRNDIQDHGSKAIEIFTARDRTPVSLIEPSARQLLFDRAD